MKILVVDDEALIRQYIVQIIREAEPAAEIVGAVAGGQKALQLLQEKSVELVFADITMPKMDGLTLLQEIKRLYPQTSVIMLTCHEDFSYARTAIQNQADDYVLKSEINVTRMRELLAKLTARRTARAAKTAAVHVERSRYLRRVFEGDEPQVTETQLRENGIDLQERAFAAVCFANEEQNLSTMGQLLADQVENLLFFSVGEQEIFAVFNVLRSSGTAEAALQRLRGGQTELVGRIGISCVHQSLAKLQTTLYEAVADYDSAFYGALADTPCTFEEGIAAVEQYIMQATACYNERKPDHCCKQLLALLDYAERCHPPVRFLLGALSPLSAAIRAKTGEAGGEDTLADCSTFRALRQYMEEETERLQWDGKNYSEPIRKAICYVKEHYTEDLLLPQVAEHVFLNRDYLSRQFKKETGKNFSEYLAELRLKQAKMLLETTDLKIAEVASAVGVTNLSYFSTIFHRTYGMTPGEVRRKKR